MWWYVFFLFVAFGSKLLLALATIYLLLPADARCSGCDGETVLLRMGPAGRALSRLFFGRLQRRWCPLCGWEGLVRAPRGEAGGSPLEAASETPTR